MKIKLEHLIEAARSLEPVEGSEYERGISELIGRALLDYKNVGYDTADNANTVRKVIHHVCTIEIFERMKP